MAINIHEKPRLDIENTGEQHLACVILVDTSESMTGYEPDLMTAISNLKTAIMDNDIARGRVEICLATFDDEVKEESSFGPISCLEIPRISCGGMTCTHLAIQFALNSVAERKEEYKKHGVTYNQPWIWLLTDGGSNDADNGSFEELLKAQREGKCTFFGVAIGEGVNEAELCGMHKDGMMLSVRKDNLAKAFEFISQSITTASAHNPGEKIRTRIPDGLQVKNVNQGIKEGENGVSDEIPTSAKHCSKIKTKTFRQESMPEQQSQELLNQADHCFMEGNIDRAINIAESLAFQKNVGGIEKVCAYRYARMISVARIIGTKDYDTLEEDCNGVINAGNTLFNMWKGVLDAQELWSHLGLTEDIINGKMNSYSSMISDAIYCLAIIKRYRDHDSDRVITLIGDSQNSRERVLCGIAYIDKEDYDTAFAIFASVYADTKYNNSKKWDGEQILYESALVGLANYIRLSSGDCEEAVRIMNTCMAGVTNEEVRSDIQKELSHYRKNIFGKWTYT